MERDSSKTANPEPNQRLGWLFFAAALSLTLVGVALVVLASQKIPVEEASSKGMNLKLVQARWILDQMDHGENYQKPSVMMPDMPEWGKQRVTLELSFENESSQMKTYDGSEFTLVPEIGEAVPPVGAQLGRAKLAPGQQLNTAIHFDFDTGPAHGKLRVAWNRDGETFYLPVPTPAEHYHLRPRGGEVALPKDARLLLPIGVAARGARLYATTYGCVACHGDLNEAASNNVGPHLGGIGRTAAERVEDLSPEQYIYDSIIDPGADIAPDCEYDRPCTAPTAMPEYASLITLQDAADLIVYLLEQTETP